LCHVSTVPAYQVFNPEGDKGVVQGHPFRGNSADL